jgi:class 3 adenylate cyclase
LMSEETPAPVVGEELFESTTAYRGFLFSDLRGYTSYLERRGDQAGAELLDRYRGIVRRTIARYEGAEIRTEGDGFYVVFPSASSAVLCGVAITGEALTASRSDPTRPIAVGVGVHAGETVERPDGFVGSAVNLAARVCAVAEPGEVLVTDTVRALTRSNVAVRFVSRGRRHLKGIDEPVALFRAEGDVRPIDQRTRLQSGAELVTRFSADRVLERPRVPDGAVRHARRRIGNDALDLFARRRLQHAPCLGALTGDANRPVPMDRWQRIGGPKHAREDAHNGHRSNYRSRESPRDPG